MCLYSNSKEPLIAEEDIVCYKILRHISDTCYVSPYQEMKYEINGLNYPEEKHNIDNIKIIDDFIVIAKNHPSYNYITTVYQIEQGFLHSYTSQGIEPLNLKMKYDHLYMRIKSFYLFECYIPKGTEYFISHCGKEICSRELFVTDINDQLIGFF